MTKHLAAAVGSVLLTAVPPRPGIAETAIAPAVQEAGQSGRSRCRQDRTRPQDHGIGRSAAAAMTAQLAPDAAGTAARGPGPALG